ncbi:unnamed protein product [Miscanthus lutarioriparius]|uniref:Uncharacterized protein n=1 Tax=Miscanthus lutarioriparius TaxID=422564 RepID=A0A811ML31_9POAL|nr:unnamed protein product [Miscanthus lutarioriparius]
MPFQMFAYRVMETEKTAAGTHASKDRATDSSSEENMLCGNENRVGASTPDDDASTMSSGTVRLRSNNTMRI